MDLESGAGMYGVSRHLKQSSLLPRSLVRILSYIYQVRTHRDDKCVVGKIIFGITVFVSVAYGVLDMLYTVYDIKSRRTKQTVTTGFFVAVLTVLWCAIGIYANRLCKRLLNSASFTNSLRLHSKTVFKIPAIVLVTVIAVGAIVVSTYKAFDKFWANDVCQTVELDSRVCQALFIIRVLQSTLVLVFNLTVAAGVLSICRTHAIGVRRFIKAVENDGIACETKHRQRFMKMKFAASHNLAELYLPEQCYGDELAEDDEDLYDDDGTDRQHLITYVPPVSTAASVNPSDTIASIGSGSAPSQTSAEPLRTPSGSDSRILSKDDILFSYWKLASRMRMSSRSLQRWMASWIIFTILWLMKWILLWIDHSASYFEIALFILPLLLVMILCIAYGEANAECARLVSSITPLQDRLDLIKTLPNIQIGMTLYNHAIQYSSVVTVVAALGLALSSRIILDEFLPPSPHS